MSAAKNSAEVGGLRVSVEMPKRQYDVGEQFTVVITAKNLTDSPIVISSPTSAMTFIKLWRYDGIVWEEFKRYPVASTVVVRKWTLPAGGKRQFFMNLIVEPDWPTAEILRLTAELNGRPEAAPALAFDVLPRTR